MTTNDLSARINRAIDIYEKAIGSFAGRTRNMIQVRGEVGALAHLMISADLQKGFKVLRDRNQLDDTFERIVVDHRDKFHADVVEAAEWRLANPYGLLNS